MLTMLITQHAQGYRRGNYIQGSHRCGVNKSGESYELPVQRECVSAHFSQANRLPQVIHGPAGRVINSLPGGKAHAETGEQSAAAHSTPDFRSRVSCSTVFLKAASSSISASIRLHAWATVAWSRPPNALPMAWRECPVSFRVRYMAT